jgi:hypothetical protein
MNDRIMNDRIMNDRIIFSPSANFLIPYLAERQRSENQAVMAM